MLQGHSAVQRVFPCPVKAAFLLAGLTGRSFPCFLSRPVWLVSWRLWSKPVQLR